MKNPVFSLLAGGRQRVKYEIASGNMGHYVCVLSLFKIFCVSDLWIRMGLNATAFKIKLAENHC